MRIACLPRRSACRHCRRPHASPDPASAACDRSDALSQKSTDYHTAVSVTSSDGIIVLRWGMIRKAGTSSWRLFSFVLMPNTQWTKRAYICFNCKTIKYCYIKHNAKTTVPLLRLQHVHCVNAHCQKVQLSIDKWSCRCPANSFELGFAPHRQS